ncbi:MAG: D-alanyl-D-alanine carboxypeptidase, partial [Methylophilaceae bacterium]|nr:D-alanyl-D-alanine carboxypeptidase [Methylophilaceae bacterium]
FIASLPILGRDGTLQNRFMGTLLAGQGQLKTGSLRAVSGLAGYLRAQSGVRYVVVVLIEHEHANTKVQDALLQWVYQH